jgi:hypothetical protein
MNAVRGLSASRTPVMTITCCLVVIMVLGTLAPGVSSAESTDAESAKDREQAAANRATPANLYAQNAAPKRSPVKPQRPSQSRQPQSVASTPSGARGYRGGRAVATVPAGAARSSAVTAAPMAGTAAPGAAAAAPVAPGGTQNQHAALTNHFIPNATRAFNVTGVTGNTQGRQASLPGVVGGPAKYDAKKGAAIGGTVVRQRPGA